MSFNFLGSIDTWLFLLIPPAFSLVSSFLFGSEDSLLHATAATMTKAAGTAKPATQSAK